MVHAWPAAVATGDRSANRQSAHSPALPDAKVRAAGNRDADLECTTRDMAPRVLRYAVARIGDLNRTRMSRASIR
jgi:hypothetical protein